MIDNGTGIRIKYRITNGVVDHVKTILGEVIGRGYVFLEDAYLGREERRFRKDVILRDIIFRPKTVNISLTQRKISRLKQIKNIQITDTDIEENFLIPQRIGERR